MPTHWLACPVYAKATFEADPGAAPSSAPATARSPSRSERPSRKGTPARQSKRVRPTPAVQAMSASRDSDEASAEAGSSPCSSSHDRYRPASSRTAASDRPESGSRRTTRSATAGSAASSSGREAGRETGIGRGGPATQRPPFAPAPSAPPPFAEQRPSSTTWAFVPDQPKPLTPARSGRPETTGQSVGVEVTCSGRPSQSIAGLGVRKWRCLGMTPRFIDSTVFMTPATPAAASRWPMFVFTEPIRSGRPASRSRPYAAPVACASIGSPTSVPVPWAST